MRTILQFEKPIDASHMIGKRVRFEDMESDCVIVRALSSTSLCVKMCVPQPRKLKPLSWGAIIKGATRQ